MRELYAMLAMIFLMAAPYVMNDNTKPDHVERASLIIACAAVSALLAIAWRPKE